MNISIAVEGCWNLIFLWWSFWRMDNWNGLVKLARLFVNNFLLKCFTTWTNHGHIAYNHFNDYVIDFRHSEDVKLDIEKYHWSGPGRARARDHRGRRRLDWQRLFKGSRGGCFWRIISEMMHEVFGWNAVEKWEMVFKIIVITRYDNGDATFSER